jgi:hypothetical protein
MFLQRCCYRDHVKVPLRARIIQGTTPHNPSLPLPAVFIASHDPNAVFNPTILTSSPQSETRQLTEPIIDMTRGMRRERIIVQLGARRDIRSLGTFPPPLEQARAADTASCPAPIPVRAAKTCPGWQKNARRYFFSGSEGIAGWTAVIARFEAGLVERAAASRRSRCMWKGGCYCLKWYVLRGLRVPWRSMPGKRAIGIALSI